jgi:preprotein translocase subunit Sec63
MRLSWVGLLFWLAVLCQVIQPVISISPYNILGVSRTATDSEVEAQYRRLRSKHRRNRARKNMAKQAYSQIMMERRFKSP